MKALEGTFNHDCEIFGNLRCELYCTALTADTLAAAVDLQRYHESSTTESMRQRNNNNVGFILLVFLLQKSSI